MFLMRCSCFKEALYILIFISPLRLSAQLIDPGATFRSIGEKSYFRFHYDNDLFTGTDHYYSQGITLEYVHPSIKKFPLTTLLVGLRETTRRAGIAFELFGYTPTSTASNEILFGDRPFSAGMALKLFSINDDAIRGQRSFSSITLGVIGPAALGKEIQTNIHRWTKNKLPRGWHHQVRNDIILNYHLKYEKKILGSDHFLLNGLGEGKIGTLHNKLGVGLNFMGGKFDNPYLPFNRIKNGTTYYLFGQGKINFVGYDAMLQGGVFNTKSPYTISSRDMERITLQLDAGIMIQFPGIYLSYSQGFLTREFRTGMQHRWGGASIGVSF